MEAKRPSVKSESVVSCGHWVRGELSSVHRMAKQTSQSQTRIRADQFGAGRVCLWASSPQLYLTTPRPTRLSFELAEVIAVRAGSSDRPRSQNTRSRRLRRRLHWPRVLIPCLLERSIPCVCTPR